MKVHIVGCYGGQLPGKRLTSFVINDTVLIDAGGVVEGLSLEQQNAIRHIVVSHGHLDHIKDIPFLADNVIGMKPEPVEVVAAEPVIATLRDHVMNNRVWPDFTAIPTKDAPVLAYRAEAPGQAFSVGDLSVELVPVNHPVPTFAMFISDGHSTVLYTADTGPTEAVWARAQEIDTLKAVITEVSFPNRLAELSLVSGHLSPCHLPVELKKLGRDDLPVYLYHFKPAFEADLIREVGELGDARVVPLAQGETLTL